MRRFIVFAALLGLTACGGPMTPEEEQAPVSSEQGASAASPSSDEVQGQGVALCNGNDPYCYCGQFTNNPTRCRQQYNPSCYVNWEGRCYPVNG